MADRAFLAFDLGAESGRAILGTLRDRRLELNELHRFWNGPVSILGHLHWDVYRLFGELKSGLKAAAASGARRPASIGIDTWGVDFGFLAPGGEILALPFCYRDPQTDGMIDRICARIGRERIYELTGIQFLQFNTLVQLFALRQRRSALPDLAGTLLFIPDILNYLLTGVARSELTIASTSQMLNPSTRTWVEELTSAVGIRPALLPPIAMPGTPIGGLADALATETGTGPVPVVAVASHDTASAVAAVPAEGTDWAYISSGTWSLMGIETASPVITPETLASNFTNELGVDGTVRFLKNIAGLWLLQECRRKWAEEGDPLTYDQIVQAAMSAPAFRSIVDPDWTGFLHPRDMREAISIYCHRTDQPAPGTAGEFARCIFESLALKYRRVLEELRQASPHPVRRLHVIGGGSRNRFLCQCTADATGLPVLAGPAEATALGNLMLQARSAGAVSSLAEMRETIGLSFVPDRYEPHDTELWDRAFDRLRHRLHTSSEPGTVP